MFFAVGKTTNSIDTWFAVKYIIVTLVFLLFLWLVSKFFISRKRNFGKRNLLKVKEMIHLTQDSYICILEVKNQFYIISGNKNSSILIDKRDDLCDFPEILESYESLSSNKNYKETSFLKKFWLSFKEQLKNIFGGGKS